MNPDIIINKNKDEGKVFLIETNEPSKEAEIVGENIIKEIRMGVKPSEIAILVKQRPEDYIRNIKEYLKTKNVTVRVESKYTETFSEPIVKLILKMILASINVINGQEWQELVDETSEIFLINLADAEIEQKYIKKLNVFLDKLFKNLLVQVHENRSKSNYYCKIVESIIDFFTINRLQVYYPEYLEIDQLNRTKTQFIEQLKECGSINELNTDIKEIWKEIIDNYLGKNSIATLTIHKSKGLEYNSVYFIGLEDSAFWSFSNQSESDRKAFFVAISRAKEKLYFTFCRGRQTVRNIYQTKKNIKEFYELFDKSGIVKEINDNNNS
ncbi:3'-5' exonuclease [Lactobacillus crispatus]|uniref:3'-5' exonuclease n=1 Tax=Lactobacillus crispatus TaxID=47770 RepID=UPI00301456F5